MKGPSQCGLVFVALFFLSSLTLAVSQSFPLKTESRWIVDQTGSRVKFACVNWYGAAAKDFIVGGLQANTITGISQLIKQQGFNCVRIPWSNQMIQTNPIITNRTIVARNPDLIGLNALTVLDRVVEALGNAGLMVILDNHMSDADWCCSGADQNGLWYNTRYSEEKWLSDWQAMARRYLKSPHVVGVDLRNELRLSCAWGGDNCRSPTWADGNPLTDWHRAAQLGGNAVLSVNPNLLIIVEGIEYATQLQGVYSNPIKLSVPNRLVYEAHDYSWFHSGSLGSYQQLWTTLGNAWGYILTQGKPYTAPVWVGEFGTCHTSPNCLKDNPETPGYWWEALTAYLANADIDWGYWAIDGTQSTGTGRTFGAEETFGILNMRWDKPASQELLSSLQKIQKKTQGP